MSGCRRRWDFTGQAGQLFQQRGARVRDRSRSVNNAETFWMLPGTFQIGLACTFKKGALFLFEAVRVAATVYPLPRHLKRHIKQKGEIRLHVWVNPFLKHCNALLAQLAAAALIGVTGVGET